MQPVGAEVPPQSRGRCPYVDDWRLFLFIQTSFKAGYRLRARDHLWRLMKGLVLCTDLFGFMRRGLPRVARVDQSGRLAQGLLGQWCNRAKADSVTHSSEIAQPLGYPWSS